MPTKKSTTRKKQAKSSKINTSSPSRANSKNKKSKKPRTRGQKLFLASLIFVLVILAGTAVTILIMLLTHKIKIADIPPAEYEEPVYSLLTGEEIASADLQYAPTYCIQIPNGNDGARPQAGLSQAGVVFEAIAERGITRFAAIFQNPSASVIGPIRSLRPYYLEWDTPFDCTVTHAGGSQEAINALAVGGQRNLDESFTYMWREDSDRNWNNLFTSASDLAQFSQDMGYNKSQLKAFPRYTPDENDEILASIITCDDTQNEEGAEPCTPTELVTDIEINFGAIPMFNTVYHYDRDTNSYLRSYANGEAHLSYNCATDLTEPNTRTACGEPTQLAPRVVVAMFVQEWTASDGYHEEISAISSGSALVFQNGDVIEASWSKSSSDSQIIFRNNAGEEIKFTPGQLWIAAVPQYGSINY